jgi:hypothetical protein
MEFANEFITLCMLMTVLIRKNMESIFSTFHDMCVPVRKISRERLAANAT